MTTVDEAAGGRTKSPGLAEHLRLKGEAMRASSLRRPRAANWEEAISAHCTADDLTGVRKLTIRDFHIVGDGTWEVGGFDLGPTSPELFLGVISTCLTHTVLCLAAWDGISLDSVSVDVRATNNDANFFHVGEDTPWPPHNIGIEMHLESASTPREELQALAKRAEETCPVMQLLRSPAPLDVSVTC